VITDPSTSTVVGGATPNAFGFLATHQAGLSRFDYEIGADQVVRWGATVPDNVTAHDPISKPAAAVAAPSSRSNTSPANGVRPFRVGPRFHLRPR